MSESKERTLYPQKLYPPPEVVAKMLERKKGAVPKNPVFRFIKTFFGEGY